MKISVNYILYPFIGARLVINRFMFLIMDLFII